MIPQLLFPWQGTIRRLELGKRWWHRLAVVLFVVVLGVTLLVTWAVMEDTESRYDTHFDTFPHSWYVNGYGANVDLPAGTTSTSVTPANSGNANWNDQFDPSKNTRLVAAPAPTGNANWFDQFDPTKRSAAPAQPAAPQPPVPVHVETHMPDGYMKEFVGKTPEEIRAAWDAELYKINIRRWWMIHVVPFLVTLAVSYLLQSLYRVLLYVVYGSQKQIASLNNARSS